jgi:hypothetical protein
MLLVLAAGLGVSALGWRLAQGPMPIPSVPAVNEALAKALAGLAPGLRIDFGRAWVAWDGWKEGVPQPVFLRLEGLRATDGAGTTRASLTAVEASFSMPHLLRGVVAPIQVVLRDPIALLRRDMQGELSLDLGISSGAWTPPAGPEATESLPPGIGEAEAGTRALEALLRAPAADSHLAALREVRVEGGMVQVRDEPLQLAWALHRVAISVTRRADWATDVNGSGALRLAGQEIPVRITGQAAGERPVAELSLAMDDVSPPALATALPWLQPLGVLESRIGAQFSARYDFGEDNFTGRAELRAAPGRIAAGEQRVPFEGAQIVLAGDGRRFELQRLELSLPPGRPGAPAPRISATARADRQGDRWRGRGEVGINAIAVPDLSLYWPPGVAEGARHWIAENLTTGVARDGRWFVEGEGPADFSAAPRVTNAGGTLRAEALTVHWLRPIPPLEGAEGTLTFSMKDIVIQARAEREAGTALAVPEARIRLYDLGVPKPDAEKAEIDARITGPLADVVTIVKHPRLHLFEKRPLEIVQFGGSVDARLSIGLPLISDLPIEQLRLGVEGKVSNGRAANVVAGLPVDQAQLNVSLDTAGMRIEGNARIASVPARARVEMDFRPGPPDQVTERARVEGRAEAGALRGLRLDPSPYLEVGGAFGVVVQAERRRSGESRVGTQADLREARLVLKSLGYVKPAGAPATAAATIRLRGEDITALEAVRVEGPELSVRGGVTFRRDNAFSGAEVLEARIGASRFTGRVSSPEGPDGAWQVQARGSLLDARGLLREFGVGSAQGSGRAARSGESEPLRLDAGFDRVLLGEGRELAPVQARAFVDAAGVLRELDASGRGVRGGGFRAVVVPRGAGRAMEARVDGFGTLLRSLGLFDAVDEGALHVAGTWSGNAPGSPLTGVAELRDFGVREAPSIGKVLQALSVYGIPEAVRGPGLRFTVLNAPFTLTPEALTLTEARAVSASLGITAAGRILRQAERFDLRGTIVPSYAVNSALGRLPGIGRLFTAERNGGLFAANFRLTGKLDDPEFLLDPLSIFAPGALRGLLTEREAEQR